MINVFTLPGKIKDIQLDVLGPLYIDHSHQDKDHDELLRFTGKSIGMHKVFIEDVCKSKFIKIVFKIVKALGFADDLSHKDFDHFTSYVNDGGLDAMLNMLKCVDMDKAFVEELNMLPRHVQRNAPHMLERASNLHWNYVHTYLQDRHNNVIPDILLKRLRLSDHFIKRLVKLAKHEVDLLNCLEEVENS